MLYSSSSCHEIRWRGGGGGGGGYHGALQWLALSKKIITRVSGTAAFLLLQLKVGLVRKIYFLFVIIFVFLQSSYFICADLNLIEILSEHAFKHSKAKYTCSWLYYKVNISFYFILF